MAVSGEPPPKRTRTDDVIARSNAHLRHLHGRRNRWTISATGDDGEDNRSSVQEDPPAASRAPLPAVTRTKETTNASASTTTITTTTTATTNTTDTTDTTNTPTAASPASPSVIVLDGDEEGATDVPAQGISEARAQSVAKQETPKMQPRSAPPQVQYEFAPTMLDLAAGPSNPRVAARKSTDPQSLPSPAPSDENTSSPRLAENHISAMRSRSLAQRVATDLAVDNRVSASGSPSAVQSPGLPPLRRVSNPQDVRVPSAVPSTNQVGQQFQPVQHPVYSPYGPFFPSEHRAPSSTWTAAYIGQGQQGQQGKQGQRAPHAEQSQQGLHPRQAQQAQQSEQARQAQPAQHQGRDTQNSSQSSLRRRSTTQPNGQPLVRPPVVPSNSGHGHISLPPASRISKEVLLTRIKQKQEELDHVLSDHDGGRLELLRSAVDRDDWFYQVLSQVFCLRSAMPALLPKSLKTVQSSSWKHVENLLCSNDEINKDLLGFFAEFPEPIMDLYSDMSNAREMYEFRAAQVRTFLIALPQYWESVSYQSHRRLAPPLVQEMAAALHLHSVVLQTTCFRATMRLFWGVEDSPGTEALLRLHQDDQATYYAYNWRRNEQEMLEALAAMRRAFEAWNEYKIRRASGILEPFILPHDVQLLFRTPPRQQQSQRQPHLLRQGQPLGQRIMQPGWTQGQAMQPSPSNVALNSPTLPFAGSNPHFQPVAAPRATSGPSSPALPHTLQGGAMPPRQLLQQRRPLFPPVGYYPNQPTDPNPNASCLQQAHLRSPLLEPADMRPTAPKLYRYVAGFVLPPATIKKRLAVQQAVFDISREDIGKIAKTSPTQTHPGAPPTRVVGESSLMYRLRCCAVPPTGFATESSWVIADNSWPPELCFELNGILLQTRRKLHHGKYLPIDVTSHVLSGTNKLKILLNRQADDKRKFDFAVAVETIGVMSHDAIKQNLRHVSAQDSLLAITKALSGTVELADDDVAVTSSNMTVSIVEPLSQTRMVDLPVRGINCLHKDVFDFEVLLSVCKRKEPHYPTVVDCWRCPLCRGDVRPHTLTVDDFLLDVRTELGNKGLLDTKAIVIESDGSWRPKAEERTGVPSPSLEREECASAAARPVEVIELD